MKKVSSITLVFENCDSMELKNSELGCVNIEGIHPVIKTLCNGHTVKYDVADLVVMEILNRKNNYSPFNVFESTNKINRIAEHGDITSIEVHYQDGTVDSYLVPYDDVDESLGAANKNQKSVVSNLGHLYLVISNKHNVSDFFEEDYINNEDIERGVYEDVHSFSPDSLPDMYKYVYLMNGLDDDPNAECVLAVRVYDAESDCKFIYENESIENPTFWQYPEPDVRRYIAGENAGKSFDMKNIKVKYPPKKSFSADELRKTLGLTNDDISDAVSDIAQKFETISKKTEETVTKGLNAAKNSQTAKNVSEATMKFANMIAEKVEELSKKH